MEIKKIKVGYLEANCYIVEDNKTCIVIDPGDDPHLIEKYIGDNTVLGILVTHSHKDHVGALSRISQKYSVPVYDFHNLSEKKYDLGGFRFEVIRNPGHSKDSISFFFYEYNFMFVGDFIFHNTVGRVDLEGGSMDEMLSSLRKISTYPKTIKLYPGHGETTILRNEIENNYYFQKAIKNMN